MPTLNLTPEQITNFSAFTEATNIQPSVDSPIPPLLQYTAPTTVQTVVAPQTSDTGSFFGNLWNTVQSGLGNILDTAVHTVVSTVTNSAVENVAGQQNVQQSLSNLGANVLQNSVAQWFQKNWIYLVGFFFAIFIVIKLANKKQTQRRYAR
ncbi:hypothetical protein [Flavobacterium sp. XGLA_31]|uniref:hypothetical protein n=1 Tax=Flavobacterium sp. XGLA_31 TaxID=3447666 RepID=UPI003F396CAB